MQPNEIAVLRALKDGSTKSIDELEELTQLDHAAVARAALSLQTQGYADVKEEKKLVTRVSDEGMRMIESGLLPEVALMREIGERLVGLADIKLPQKELALGWAKSKGWVQISGEGVKATALGKKESAKEQREIELLKDLSRATAADLAMLRRRKFVESEEKSVRKVTLTKEGLSLARHAKDVEEVSQLTPQMIKTGEWKKVRLRKYNIMASGPKVWPGKKQPYRAFLDEVKKKLLLLGFKEMTGPLVDLEFWNFDALYQPQNHPARDWASTYQLRYPESGRLPDAKLVARVKAAHENGGGTGGTGWRYRWSAKHAARLMPRAHTTTLSARWLAKGIEIPGKYFAIGRCYRPDVTDATHLIEFNQIEGIVAGPNLNLRSILGILEMFAKEFAGAKEVRFIPDYYPFTEPSVQMSARHPKLGWIEFGGSGIFREELTKPLGVKVPVIAWGLGIDRLAMLRLGINDIRNLFSYDLDWLRKEKFIAGA